MLLLREAAWSRRPFALSCSRCLFFAVEAFYQKHIVSGGGFDAACRKGDTAGFCELQHSTFDARVVPAVIPAVEFLLSIGHRCLRRQLSDAHRYRCTDQHQILDRHSFPGFVTLLAHQRFSDFLELREFDGFVELTPRRWCLLGKAETEGAGAVIR